MKSINPEIRKTFTKRLLIRRKRNFHIKEYSFLNKRKNPSPFCTFKPKDNLKNYKINDNVNTFTLLRSYKFNQIKKTVLISSVLNIYKCGIFLEAY